MMTHRIPSLIRLALSLLLATAGLIAGAVSADAQQLAITPGLQQVYTGEYQSTSSASSPANYAGPLSNLVMYYPAQITFDKSGNLYIAEWLGDVVQVVAASSAPIPALPGITPQAGYVYTVAGNGSLSPSASCTASELDTIGDGCLATAAALRVTGGVTVDANGNVFIPDSFNYCLRVVYSGKGTIPGLPANAQAGYIYLIAGTPKTESYSGDGEPATSATMKAPYSVAVDSNENIFVVDNLANTVRVVYSGTGSIPGLPSSAQTGYIYTIAGSSSSSCSTTKIAASECGVGGPAAAALFNSPKSIAFDPSGNLYISDSSDDVLGAIYFGSGSLPGISSPATGDYYIIAGGGTGTPNGVAATSAVLPALTQVSFDAGGSIYLAGGIGKLVYRVDPTGMIYTIFGDSAGTTCASAADMTTYNYDYGDGCPATQVALGSGGATGVAVDASGNVYVVDENGGPHNKGLIRESLVSSPTLPYTEVLGGAAQTQTVDVYNTGAAALKLSGLSSPAAPFSIIATGGSTDCTSTTSLAPGAACQIGIGFAPSSVGSYTGSIPLQSNATNAPYTISLTGTATAQPTVTALQLTPFQVSSGEPVTFTAAVSGPAGSTIIPTGTVNFVTTGSSPVTLAANVQLNSSGVATVTSPLNLTAGTYGVTAQYGGDPNSLASSYTGSQPLTVTTLQTPLITVTSSVTSSPATITQGSSVTLTATVAPYSGSTNPTGKVTFQIGDIPLIPLSGTNPVTLSAGTNGTATATFTTTALPVGSDVPTVSYSGDSNYAAAYGSGSAIEVQATSAAQLVFYPGISTPLTLPSSAGTGGGSPNSGQGTVALDANGNLYYPLGNIVYVAYFGKGTIPGYSASSLVSNTIYPVAGGGNCSNNSSGVAATQMCFNQLKDLKLDTAGNLYVLDSVYNSFLVWKVSAGTGIANIVAGEANQNGAPHYGSLATQTSLYYPSAIAVDNAGNLYIADDNVNISGVAYETTIDRVDALTGVITLVAGTPGKGGYTGDGGAALGALLNGPNALAIDGNGNLDIADGGNTGSNVVRQINAQTGVITTIAGSISACTTNHVNANGTNGDGGAATEACLYNPQGLLSDRFGNLFVSEYGPRDVREVYPNGTIVTAINSSQLQDEGVPGVAEDSQGNLYVANEYLTQITRSSNSMTFNGNETGAASTVVTNVFNDGNAPLTFSTLGFPSGFPQQPSGGTDCAAGMTVAADSTGCAIGIGFFPSAPGNSTGTVTISDNAGNATSGTNTIAVSGTNLATGTGNNSIIWDQTFSTVTYGATTSIPLTATSSAGNNYSVTYSATGPATVSGSTLTITGAGPVSVTAYQFGDGNAATAMPVTKTFTVSPATITVTAGNVSVPYGAAVSTVNSELTFTTSALVGSDTLTGAASVTTNPVYTTTTAAGTQVYTIPAQGTLAVSPASHAGNYQFAYQDGTLTISGNQAQTISWNQTLATVTYGQTPIQLQGVAAASSGLPVTYSVSPQSPATINGTYLTITGQGTVEVIASQPGNADYGAAPSINQSFLVNRATITVTADNQTVAQGNALPAFTATYSGFVPGDSGTVISGSPAFTTNAPASPGIGTYTITPAAGTLTAANYTFAFATGTLSVVQGTAQTITFNEIPTLTYGVAPFQLQATSSSKLPVTYTASGAAAINQTSSGYQLVIVGAGKAVVTASQPGQGIYTAAAPVVQPFTVQPATLTVTATNVTRTNNVPNPAFPVTISGYVNGDTASVVGGQSVVTTAATPASPVGTYPINLAQGNLNAANYAFAFVPGTLTIAPGGPTPDYSLSATPNVLTIAPGQSQQATITLTPINYFQGTVQLSCGTLPKNVTCIFSPAAFNVDGSGNPVSITLTVNTDDSVAPVGMLTPSNRNQIFTAAFFWLPGGITGLLIAFNRRKLAKHTHIRQWMILLVLLTGLAGGLTACGGSSSTSSQVAAPGTSTVSITAAGSSTNLTGTDTHNLNLTIKIQGAQ